MIPSWILLVLWLTSMMMALHHLNAGSVHRQRCLAHGASHVEVRQLTGRRPAREPRQRARPVVTRNRGILGQPFSVVCGLTVVTVVAGVAIGAVAATYALLRPMVASRNERRSTDLAIRRELSEVTDLFTVALAAGHNVTTATREVSSRSNGVLSSVLNDCVEQTGRGRLLAEALDEVVDQCGPVVRPLIGALVASERWGVPIVASLRQVSDDIRIAQRRQAEATARRLPVTMLFPLVVCILPAFGLLTVVPVLIDSLQSLRI